jgi:replicative DNA helicase
MNYNINYSVECLLGLERAILSSLISYNNVDKIEDCLKIIESKDFYYEQHGIIYDSIILLYKNDKRVDENNVFLTNQTNINEQYYIDVIATTPLDSINDSIKKLKEYSLQRQITTVAAQIKEGDFNQICKLQDLQEKFENLNSVRNLKKIDDKFEKLISDFDLDLKKLKNKKIEYLYDQFILKNDIIMFVARPGVGKSLMALALCNMLLDAKKVKRVFSLYDGVIVGLLIGAAWFVTGYIGSESMEKEIQVQAISFVYPSAKTLELFTYYQVNEFSFGVCLVIGALVGTFVSTLFNKKYSFGCTANKNINKVKYNMIAVHGSK